MRMTIVSLAAALLAACGAADPASSNGSPISCNDPGNSSMCPGDDCLACHGFKAGGTVFAAAASSTAVGSATVTFVDKNGVTVTRTSNSAGNFYTSSALTFPLQRVTISKGASTVEMLDVADGHCNACHEPGARIHLP